MENRISDYENEEELIVQTDVSEWQTSLLSLTAIVNPHANKLSGPVLDTLTSTSSSASLRESVMDCKINAYILTMTGTANVVLL